MRNKKIDISFGNLSYLRNLDTMRSFLEKYQMARPIILLLKYLLHQNNLNITYQGGLGSYTLLVLVVHFIMVIPSFLLFFILIFLRKILCNYSLLLMQL